MVVVHILPLSIFIPLTTLHLNNTEYTIITHFYPSKHTFNALPLRINDDHTHKLLSQYSFIHSIPPPPPLSLSLFFFAGVPLAKSDPFSELNGQNNIAPLDPNGGHSTLQMTYHYHAIPTIFFDCESGWDSSNLVWADAAPDGNHSPLIG